MCGKSLSKRRLVYLNLLFTHGANSGMCNKCGFGAGPLKTSFGPERKKKINAQIMQGTAYCSNLKCNGPLSHTRAHNKGLPNKWIIPLKISRAHYFVT
jgi:hypothetical protein